MSSYKCPFCGETLEAFSTSCPSCGNELHDLEPISSVKDFAEKMAKLEARNDGSAFGKIARTVSKTAQNAHKDIIVEKKRGLIINYPVPNTKEDIYEFFVMALSNVNEELYSSRVNTAEKKLADIWLKKAEQLYQKSAIVLNGDPSFELIKNMYESKVSKINEIVEKSKRKRMLIVIGIVGFYVLCFVILLIIAVITN